MKGCVKIKTDNDKLYEILLDAIWQWQKVNDIERYNMLDKIKKMDWAKENWYITFNNDIKEYETKCSTWDNPYVSKVYFSTKELALECLNDLKWLFDRYFATYNIEV